MTHPAQDRGHGAPRVFVVNLPYRRGIENTIVPAVNISNAYRYGEIVMLLDTQFRLPVDLTEIVDEIKEGMKDFAKDDYLLLVGDQGALGVAMACAAQLTGRYVNVLRWDYDSYEYMPLKFDLLMPKPTSPRRRARRTPPRVALPTRDVAAEKQG